MVLLTQGNTFFSAHLKDKYIFPLENQFGDFPGGTVVKNLPAHAGNMGSRKIPQAAEELSPYATATEPAL